MQSLFCLVILIIQFPVYNSVYDVTANTHKHTHTHTHTHTRTHTHTHTHTCTHTHINKYKCKRIHTNINFTLCICVFNPINTISTILVRPTHHHQTMRNGFPGINYLLQLVGYYSHTPQWCGAAHSYLCFFQIQRFLISSS